MASVNFSRLRERLLSDWSAAGVTEEVAGWQGEHFDDSIWYLTNYGITDHWAHQSQYALLRGSPKCPGIDVAGDAIDVYLDMPHLHCAPLDWMHADVTVFSEVNATSRVFGGNAMVKEDGSLPVWWLLTKVAFSLTCWAIWLLIAATLYLLHPLWLAGWVVLTIITQYKKWKAAKYKRELLSAMADVYSSLDNIRPSWRNVYALMEKSRDKGAKWPIPLYRLVEKNMKDNP